MSKAVQNITVTASPMTKINIPLIIACKVFLVVLLSCTPDTHADQLEITYIEYPPYYYTQNGRPEGFLFHLTNAVMRNAGVDANYKAMPSKRVLHEISSGGQRASIGWFKTREREHFARFSIPIYENRPIGILFRKEDERLFSRFRTLKDLLENSAVKTATVSGHSLGEYVDSILKAYPEKIYRVSGKQEQLVKMLKNGRQDFCLLAPEEVLQIVERCGYTEDDFAFMHLDDIPAGNRRHLMFSKSVAPETIEKINTAIAELVGIIGDKP